MLRKLWRNPSRPSIIVAGTGCQGSTATTLYKPHGIFVTEKFELYVADCDNHRIQLFRSDEIDATTVAGNGSNGTTITLTYPTGVMLDGDGYLFIVDYGNDRIIGSDRWGFRCVVDCEGIPGSAANQLDSPWTMSFDSAGNLLVCERDNHRVQKFILSTNSCDCKSKRKESDGVFLSFFHS